jgi:hypothetical protein
MREYGKVYTAFWSDPTIRSMSEDARVLALYLLTCQHGNSIGLFRLPNAYAADDLQWTTERVSKGFLDLIESKFLVRETTSNWLVIPKYTKWNGFENPKVAIGAMKILEAAPDGDAKSLCARSIAQFGAHLTEEFRNRLDTLSKGYRNKEPSQSLARAKPKPEPEPEPNRSLSSADALDPALEQIQNPVAQVFEHWRTVMGHPNAQLDDDRRKRIRNALKDGYTVEQLCRAIDGCKQTPHNMGHNDRNGVYDGLHVILKSADQIDRFIRNAQCPPRLLDPVDEFVRMGQGNVIEGEVIGNA